MDFEKRYASEIQLLGQRLKEIRREKGLTQVDMEVRTGINNGDISRIEQGKVNVEFFTIVKFAEALEVGIGELFGEGKKQQVEAGKTKTAAKKTAKKK